MHAQVEHVAGVRGDHIVRMMADLDGLVSTLARVSDVDDADITADAVLDVQVLAVLRLRRSSRAPSRSRVRLTRACDAHITPAHHSGVM